MKRSKIKGTSRKVLASITACLAFSSLTGFSSVKAESVVTTTPIKHTVVIFQENRTFDNYFGTYPYAPGFNPISGTPKDVHNFNYVAGSEVRDSVTGQVYNLDENGKEIFPWHDAGHADIQETDVNHSYGPMIQMVDGGKMDQFYMVNHNSNPATKTNDKGLLSMSYFDYTDIPAYWQYAQHYALSDNFHQPVYGPSTPGALYLVAAQSGNGNSTVSGDVYSQITGDPSPKNGPFGGDSTNGLKYNLTYKNIGDELSDANQSWAWYAGGWDAAKATPGSADALKYSPHHNPFQYFQNYENGAYNNNLKDYDNFAQDVANGTLPTVSFVKGGYGDDEHPGTGNQSTPSAEDFTVKTINQIMNSPYWKDTAIIVTYDEGGGFYDHVAPSSVTPNADGLLGDGPRIPALVISPYAKQNYVSHVQMDHASILKFIESNYNLPALNSKDAAANNLTDMFDFNHPSFQPFVYQLGSSSDPGSDYYHDIHGEINLNGATKDNATVTLVNTQNNTQLTAKYGQILASQYGDYGVTDSVYNSNNLQYHFEVPAGNYQISVGNGSYSASGTVNANSKQTMTYNGVTFYDDKTDLELYHHSSSSSDYTNNTSGNSGSTGGGGVTGTSTTVTGTSTTSTSTTTSSQTANNQQTGSSTAQKQKPAISLSVPNLHDVQGNWAAKQIEKLISTGAINGYPDGEFKPNNQITRAEFIAILVKALSLNDQPGHVFTDTENHWAKNAISTAVANGIVHGLDANNFGADKQITREQMAVMIVNALKLGKATGDNNFADYDQISPWAKDAVLTAREKGIIHGYQDNTFRPEADATRAEAVAIIVNALELQNK